jgi:pyruvate kinase
LLMSKILVTLGPTSMNKQTIEACAQLGVYLFRINLSHTPLDQIQDSIDSIKSWTDIPICLDSEGAQLRNGLMINESVEFKKGDKVNIQIDPIVGDTRNLSFNPIGAIKQLEIGDKIRVDFNHVCFEVMGKFSDHFSAIVVHSGSTGSNKSADVNRDLIFDPLTTKDRQAIKIGLKNNIKNFAMSFTNLPQDVELLRNLCGPESNIICKIESPLGLQNLVEIIERADEILIDRGDLSRRVPIERIPFLQRRIISIARTMNTPVFVATNLLESMIKTQSPNRAEVNDVVSTLEMGANGLVLAAETAIGEYPVKAVEMIRSLITEYERWKPDNSINEILID